MFKTTANVCGNCFAVMYEQFKVADQTLNMKTILIPTDFSATARNAALYAIKLASQLQAAKIIFYNAYLPPPVVNEPASMPAIPMVDIDIIKNASIDGLAQFVTSLQTEIDGNIEVDQLCEYADLTTDIDDLCEKTSADIIVLGITGTSKIEEVLIGSTALSIVKQTKVPVIVVPEGAHFIKINNILLASDLKKVSETTPVSEIKAMLNATHARLHILNVFEDAEEVSADAAYQKELLSALLHEYEPDFHFVRNDDFIAGINQFVVANQIDMIITIPKRHGFLQGLFRERHTKKLAFHSHVPLMYIHQQDL